MFVTRLISGIVLVILSVLILYFGGMVTLCATVLLSYVGIYELMRVYKMEDSILAYSAYCVTFFYYLILYLGKNALILPLMIVYLLVVLSIYVLKFPKYHDKDVMGAFFAFFYVSVCLSYVFRLRSLKDGGMLIILVFICSWGNDTLAYCTGRLFGKHKMSPVLSPKKSVEGLIGGIVGAGILGLIFGLFFNKFATPLTNAPLWFALVGAIGAIPAVIGDLAASAIKRNNEIKDYGKLIPGHGGVLDRFDSMIFTAPIIYYCVQAVMNFAGK